MTRSCAHMATSSSISNLSVWLVSLQPPVVVSDSRINCFNDCMGCPDINESLHLLLDG
ncbi:hypothetical protein PILCRDRAFT_594030 [Piloderma croceum F 1598]|uniref:Uncharacterized protein n=1 Tax=Piloderma croceum (strain F 1598) TaxID=765440 RepID=A0A0C3FEF8_PILCF|nr:hypothetical protein PILCRDRAFT_594030 [Piloderma croceum F 1598]